MAAHWNAIWLFSVVCILTLVECRISTGYLNENQIEEADDEERYSAGDVYEELSHLKQVHNGMGVTYPPDRPFMRVNPGGSRFRRPVLAAAAANRRAMLAHSLKASGRRPDLAHIKNRGFHLGAMDLGKTPRAFAINPFSGKPEPLVFVQPMQGQNGLPIQGRRLQGPMSASNRYQANAFVEEVHAPNGFVSPFHYMRRIEQLKAAQQHQTAQAAAMNAARIQAAAPPQLPAAPAVDLQVTGKPINFDLPTQPPPQQSSRTVDLSDGFCEHLAEIKDYCLGKPAAHYGHPNVLCYIQCDGRGAAFVNRCAEGTYWVRGYGPAGHNNCRKL